MARIKRYLELCTATSLHVPDITQIASASCGISTTNLHSSHFNLHESVKIRVGVLQETANVTNEKNCRSRTGGWIVKAPRKNEETEHCYSAENRSGSAKTFFVGRFPDGISTGAGSIHEEVEERVEIGFCGREL